jgi:sentrin-specific protease 8
MSVKSTKDVGTNTSDRHLICMDILGSKWLTDDTIQMYFDALTAKVIRNDIFLMNPVLTQALKCLEDTNHFVEPLKINSKNFIFFPINDSPSIDQAGGSHWSLLLYSKGQNKFFYLDSSADYNITHAQQVVNKVSKYLGLTNQVHCQKVMVPQQNNSVDCGIYMLIFTDVLIQIIQENKFSLISDQPNNFCQNLVIEACDILTKRARLALLLYNSNHTLLSADTLKNMMYCPTTPFKADSASIGCPSTSSKPKVCKQAAPDNNTFLLPLTNRFTPLNNCTKDQPTLNSKEHRPISNKKQQSNQRGTAAKVNTSSRNRKHIYQKKINRSQNEEDTIPTKINKVHVYGDSHGKDIGNLIGSLLPRSTETYVYASPGATSTHILNEANDKIQNFTKDDTVVVIAGANDISERSPQNHTPTTSILESFQHFAATNKHTNIVYLTQFHRHDLPWDSMLNKKIYKLNYELKQLNTLNILSVSDFTRNFFTVHGQHLNKYGKQVLSRRIADFVIGIDIAKKYSLTTSSKSFNIIEADMRDIIEKYCNDSEVGFAHCISSDFQSDKQMSQGVAVAFKEKFGKPDNSSYCGKHLTCQKTPFGASVYGLVTKPKFFLNARTYATYKDSYDRAFLELAQDFKNQNLKTLICSPMGCIRDRVQPDHFINNLINFKEDTGANIIIVTCDDTSKSNLRNGLTHKNFLKFLRQILVNKLYVTAKNTSNESSPPASLTVTSSSDTTTSITSEVCTSLMSPDSGNDTSLQFSSVSVSSDEGSSLSQVPSVVLQESLICVPQEIDMSPTTITLPKNCTSFNGKKNLTAEMMLNVT